MSVTNVAKSVNLFRKLKDVLLINSSVFATTTPTEQTAVLMENNGLPVLFVPNFNDLSDKRLIRDKLLRGDDVSRELEFNGLELSDEDIRVLSLVRPILEKIGAIGPKYPWSAQSDIDDAKAKLTFGKVGSTERVTRNGHYITANVARIIWRKASKYWATGGNRPTGHDVKGDGSYYSSHHVAYTTTGVSIGCQTGITRAEIEAVAQHYGWDPNLA